VIYLEVPVTELARRLRADSVVRPLLMDTYGKCLSSEMLERKIRVLMQKRTPFYRRAHVVLPSVASPSVLAYEAAQAIRRYNLKDLR